MSELPELDAIRQHEKAATPGPWRLITDSCDCGDGYGCPHGDWPHAFRLTAPRQVEINGKVTPTEDWHYEYTEIFDLPMETAEFIVAARQDVPYLLGIVDAVLALAGQWERDSDEMRSESVRAGLHPALASGHREANLLRQRAADLRAALSGQPVSESVPAGAS